MGLLTVCLNTKWIASMCSYNMKIGETFLVESEIQTHPEKGLLGKADCAATMS